MNTKNLDEFSFSVSQNQVIDSPMIKIITNNAINPNQSHKQELNFTQYRLIQLLIKTECDHGVPTPKMFEILAAWEV